jgi:HPt (histidine-containing phosphotransfer) domain-containing protein
MNDYLPKPFTPEDLYHKLFDDLKIRPANIQARSPKSAGKKDIAYNLDYLRAVSGNNEEFIREMVTTFIQTVPGILEDMSHSMDGKDWMKLSRLAHQIKPSFTLMGLDSLRSDIVFIEENSKLETNLPEVMRITGEFLGKCSQIIPRLSKEALSA